MSMTGIILAALVVGGTGLFIGVFLGIAVVRQFGPYPAWA